MSNGFKSEYKFAPAVRQLERLLAGVQQYQQKLLYYGWAARRQPHSKLNKLVQHLDQPYALKVTGLAESLRKLGARPVGMNPPSKSEPDFEKLKTSNFTAILRQLWLTQSDLLKQVHKTILLTRDLKQDRTKEVLQQLLNAIRQDLDTLREHELTRAFAE